MCDASDEIELLSDYCVEIVRPASIHLKLIFFHSLIGRDILFSIITIKINFPKGRNDTKILFLDLNPFLSYPGLFLLQKNSEKIHITKNKMFLYVLQIK